MRPLKYLWLILISASTLAQNANEKFGKLSSQDLLKTHSEIDSTADAEVLFDKGTITFEYDENMGFCYRTLIHKRIKIYKSSALEKGNFSLPIYYNSGSEQEILSRIKGVTYNLVDGKINKDELSKKSIFYEKVNNSYAREKVTMPNVREGSVVELSYQRITPISLLNSPRTWYFQSDLPVKSSVLDITIPNHFFYQVTMGGYLALAQNARENVSVDMGNSLFDTNGMRYILEVKDAPAFKDEKFITTPSDYISKIDFELSSVNLPNRPEQKFNESWESLDRTLLQSEYYGRKLKASKPVKAIAAKYVGVADDNERLNAIFNYFTRTFEWNEENRLWIRTSTKKIIEDKTGNSSELNVLLCAVLREAGFDANPVILSTRNNGKISTTFPLLDRFNSTIVAVNKEDKLVFMDATYSMSKPGELPQMCLVNEGRIIRESGGEFVPIKAKDIYTEIVMVKAEIDPEDGRIHGSLTESSAGILGNSLKMAYKKSGEEAFLKAVKESQEEWVIDDINLEGFEETGGATKLTAKFEKEEGGIMPDMIYMPAILSVRVDENPFKKKERLFPVDFGHKTSRMFQGQFTIPEGFEVESLPTPISLALPNGGGKFMFTVVEKGGVIQSMSRIVLKKSEYMASEYPYLREFYAKIVEKHAEQIVLSSIE